MATAAGSISGVGGGVIIKPVLDAVSTMSTVTVSFLSAFTVLAMTVTSMLYSRGGPIKLEKRRGSLLAIGASLGGIVGKQVFEILHFTNEATLDIVQQVMMTLLTSAVFIYTIKRDKIKTKDVKRVFACLIIGLVLGLVSAFLGIGGGPLNLAVLYFFFGMDSKTAALNSLYIILFSQTASLIMTFVGNAVPEFSRFVLIAMCSGGILGGLLGQNISVKLTNRGIDRLFLMILIVITLISFYNLARCFV